MISVARAAIASESSRPALLLALRALAADVAAIELESADGNGAAIEQVSRAVCQLLERALAVLAALQCGDDDTLVVEVDAVDPGASPGAPATHAIAQVGDVCFAGTMELKRVLRELVAAVGDDARLVAVEAGRRKLRRAIHAVLDAARDPGAGEVIGEPGRHPCDLASALAIRRLYARFRRALRRAESETPEAVLSAVRYAGGALATLITDPEYADVRASDRTVLRRLHERALHWARHDRSVSTGLHLLEDVWICGGLLRGINRRQELRAYDAALIAVLLRGPDDDVAAWFAQLDALFGLDDNLDNLLERARQVRCEGRPLDPLVSEALVRLAQVH